MSTVVALTAELARTICSGGRDGEQDLLELQKSARSVNDAKARLEREHTRDEKGLQAASSDWQRLNHLADEWLSSDPTQDRLPLEGKERSPPAISARYHTS